MKADRSDFRHDLAPFFPRLGPNWVQCLRSKDPRLPEARLALFSVRQVAQLLGVSTATVYRLCGRGELAHFRVSHAIRIRLLDLTSYVDAQEDR